MVPLGKDNHQALSMPVWSVSRVAKRGTRCHSPHPQPLESEKHWKHIRSWPGMLMFQSTLPHPLTTQLHKSGKRIPFMKFCSLNSLRDMELFLLWINWGLIELTHIIIPWAQRTWNSVLSEHFVARQKYIQPLTREYIGMRGKVYLSWSSSFLACHL